MKERKFFTANSMFFPPWDFILSIFFHTTKAEGKKGARTYFWVVSAVICLYFKSKNFLKIRLTRNFCLFVLLRVTLSSPSGRLCCKYIYMFNYLGFKAMLFPKSILLLKKDSGLMTWCGEEKSDIFMILLFLYQSIVLNSYLFTWS